MLRWFGLALAEGETPHHLRMQRKKEVKMGVGKDKLIDGGR